MDFFQFENFELYKSVTVLDDKVKFKAQKKCRAKHPTFSIIIDSESYNSNFIPCASVKLSE